MMEPGLRAACRTEDLVKDFGIDVESKYYSREPAGGGRSEDRPACPAPVDVVRTNTKRPKSQPVVCRRSPTVFQNAPGFVRMVPALASPLPKDVDAKVLVKTAASTDIWGETTFSQDAS